MNSEINKTQPQETPGVSHKIIRNTAYNIVGRFWTAAIAVFLTPFILRQIGPERFGVWAVVGVLTGYFGLLDFGISASFVKFLTELYTKKDTDNINRIISSGFTFYCLFTVISTLIFLVFSSFILAVLKVPPYMATESFWVFLLGIALFGVSNALSVFSALQIAMQRMDISNKIAIIVSIPNAIGIIVFLKLGYGLLGLMMNNILIFSLTTILNVAIAYKLMPGLRFSPFSFDKGMFKQLFNFGYKVQIAKLSGVVTGQTDKILIAYFLSLGLVTFYQLGNSIVYYAITVSTLLVSALMPAFQELEARGERQRLIEAYYMSSKYLTFFVAPLFLFLVPAANNIMFAWMGSTYDKAAVVIQVLALSWMLNCIAQIAASLCMAVNKPQLMSSASLLIVVSNIILSIAFVKMFGFYGIAWGTMVSVNIGSFFFMFSLHKSLQMPFRKLFNTILPFCLSAFISALVIFVINRTMIQLHMNFGRYQTIAVIAVKAIIFSIVYLLCVRIGRMIDIHDAEFLKGKFPKVYSVIIKVIPELCQTKS